MSPTRSTLPRILAPLGGLLVLLASCASFRDAAEVEYARPYPAAKRLTSPLDVQVFREDTTLRFTNTSPRRFGPVTLWLNEWYSRPVDAIEVGESVVLPLRHFRDEHSVAIRSGGFWATRAAERIVSAHIETEQELVPLVVIDAAD